MLCQWVSYKVTRQKYMWCAIVCKFVLCVFGALYCFLVQMFWPSWRPSSIVHYSCSNKINFKNTIWLFLTNMNVLLNNSLTATVMIWHHEYWKWNLEGRFYSWRCELSTHWGGFYMQKKSSCERWGAHIVVLRNAFHHRFKAFLSQHHFLNVYWGSFGWRLRWGYGQAVGRVTSFL